MMETPIKLDPGESKEQTGQVDSSLQTVLALKTRENNFSFVNVPDTSVEVLGSIHSLHPRESHGSKNVQVSEVYQSESQKIKTEAERDTGQKNLELNQYQGVPLDMKYSISGLQPGTESESGDIANDKVPCLKNANPESADFQDENRLYSGEELEAKTLESEESVHIRNSEQARKLKHQSTEDTQKVDPPGSSGVLNSNRSLGLRKNHLNFLDEQRASLELKIYRKTFTDSQDQSKLGPREPFKSFGVEIIANSNLTSKNQTINNDSVHQRSKGRVSKQNSGMTNSSRRIVARHKADFQTQNQVSIDSPSHTKKSGFHLKLMNTLKDSWNQDRPVYGDCQLSPKRNSKMSNQNAEHSEYSDNRQSLKQYKSSRSHGFEKHRNSAVNLSQVSRKRLKGMTTRGKLGHSAHGSSNPHSPIISRKKIKNLVRSTFKILDRSKQESIKKPSHKQTTSILKEMRKQAKQRTSVRDSTNRSSLLRSLKKINVKGLSTNRIQSQEKSGPKSSNLNRKKSPFTGGSKNRVKIFGKKNEVNSKFNLSGKYFKQIKTLTKFYDIQIASTVKYY